MKLVARSIAYKNPNFIKRLFQNPYKLYGITSQSPM